MSRCAICDYSQSADSTYNAGLQLRAGAAANRVVYDKKMGKDVCLHCLEDHFDQMNYWKDVDGISPEFNALETSVEDFQEYRGCTDKQAD